MYFLGAFNSKFSSQWYVEFLRIWKKPHGPTYKIFPGVLASCNNSIPNLLFRIITNMLVFANNYCSNETSLSCRCCPSFLFPEADGSCWIWFHGETLLHNPDQFAILLKLGWIVTNNLFCPSSILMRLMPHACVCRYCWIMSE